MCATRTHTNKISFVKNLYSIRVVTPQKGEMNVYKKGSSIKINGLLFWI